LRDVIALYREHGARIFTPQTGSMGGLLTPKYNTKPLREALDDVFKDARLKDSKARLLIPTTDIGNGSVHVFKSAYDPEFVRDPDVKVVDAIVASCSAPLYFTPAEVEPYLLCDGGLWANNPSLVALTEASSRLRFNRADIHLLSIGTGVSTNFYPMKSKYWAWGFVSSWGTRKFISMLLNLQSQTASNLTKLLLNENQLVRVNFTSDIPLPLDEPEIIDDMVSRADRDFSRVAADIAALMKGD
jgi:patatin-like phospholipase/acyl hydrolase